MNKHRQRVKEEEAKLAKQRKKYNKVSFFGIIICVALAMGVTAIAPSYYGKSIELNENPWVGTGIKESSNTVKEKSADWRLILVNRKNSLPTDFAVKLKDFQGEMVDERIHSSLNKMIKAASDEGVELLVCSGYRSVDTQNILFERKVREWMDSGLGEEASIIETQKYLQPPGASEHHTGLAVDIVWSQYTTLDSGFADTVAYEWLSANAEKYGFIERYKKDKEKSTGVNFEPWHYRYTGTELAKKINASGLSLEEYVKKSKKS